MISKGFVLAFLAIIALQGASAKTVVKPRGFFGNILEGLENLVSTVIDAAINVLFGLLNDLTDLAEELIAGGKKLVQTIISNVKHELEKLIEEIGHGAAEVQECVAGPMNDLQAIADATTAEIESCINKEVQTGKDFLDVVGFAIQDMRKDVTDLVNKFQACVKISCYLDVAEQATKLIETVPSEISKLVDDAKNIIKGIQENLSNCVSKSVEEMETKVLPVVEEVKKCLPNAA